MNLFGFFGFDCENFGTFVIAAVRTNPMGDIKVVAVGTVGEVLCLERKMAAAAVTASLGKFPFWKRWHGTP